MSFSHECFAEATIIAASARAHSRVQSALVNNVFFFEAVIITACARAHISVQFALVSDALTSSLFSLF